MPAELRERATESCPKHMTYGPCGGVRDDGACEIDAALACPFVPLETVRWHGVEPGLGTSSPDRAAGPVPSEGAATIRSLLRTRPIVVADFPARAVDAASIEACAEVLRGSVDAVLAGDSGSARVQFSPAYRARLIQDAGLLPWVGINCRDRNRVAIEAELAGLAQLGAAGVHCITGDHTQTGSRPDAKPVFDLDSTELASLARATGHLVSVAETPVAPPVGLRPARLLEKQRAGAQVCFVNHSGGVEAIAGFVERSRAIGVTVDFIPCVPIILDEESAAMIRSFTSLMLAPGYVEAILDAPDRREAGIEAAVRFAASLLEIEGVVGVDLSGGPTRPGTEVEFAGALAEISRRIRAAHPGSAG